MTTNPSQHISQTPRRLFAVAAVLIVAVVVRAAHDYRKPAGNSLSALAARVQANPGDEQALLDWSDALHTAGRSQEAEQALARAADLRPMDARPYNALAALALERQDDKTALKEFRASLECNPRDSNIWRSAGLLFQSERDSASATQAYANATSIDPKDEVAWRQLGSLEASGAPAKAIQDLQRAVSLNPGDAYAESLLGTVALQDGRIAIAQPAFDQALKLNPHDELALIGAARVTMQMEPTPAGLARASGWIDEAMAAHPPAGAYLARGQWNLLQHRYQPAVEDLRTALKMDKTLKSAHSFLARACMSLGNTAEAQHESALFLAANHSGQ
jgi:Flp pilus assembly protein TadD